MDTVTFSFSRALPVSGEQFTRSVTFKVSPSKDGVVLSEIVSGRTQMGSSYSFPSLEDAEQWFAKRHEKQYESAVMRAAEERRVQAQLAAFTADLQPKVMAATEGLQTQSSIIDALVAAVTYQRNALEDLRRAIDGKTVKQLRADLRSALSAGREYARDQYPDDYREAEDKEDFYEEYADEVSEGFVLNFTH